MVFVWKWCGVVANTARFVMIIIYEERMLEVGIFPALQLRYYVV